MKPTLYVDSGSTLIKWGLAAASDAWIEKGVCAPCDAALGRASESAGTVVVADVAGKNRIEAIRGQVGSLEVELLAAQKEALGVRNPYDPPDALGIDRWCAVVAAYRMEGECLVLTAGTALTINWVDGKGQFRGGAILPGTRLMRSALAGATCLDANAMAGESRPPARDTRDAVAAGVRLAVVGAVRMFERECGTGENALPVVISGGGGEEIGGWLPDARIENDLVIEGMRLLRPPGKA